MLKKLKDAWNFIYTAGDNMVNHDGIEHAGYLSFVLLLAFFPFIVFFVAILGALGETQMGATFVNMLLNNIPQDVMEVVRPRIYEILSGPPTGLLTISILGTIWTSSSMIEGFRTILNRAYRVHTPPNYYWRRSLSILQLIMLTVLLICIMFALVLMPIIVQKIYGFFDTANAISRISYGHEQYPYIEISFFGVEWAVIRKAAVVGVLFLFISGIYYWLPNVKQSWVRTFPGALVAVVGWLFAARAISYYLSNFNQFNLVYGSLGSIIAFLIFFYIINIIFIFGAEFNYLLDQLRGVKIQEREKTNAKKRKFRRKAKSKS